MRLLRGGRGGLGWSSRIGVVDFGVLELGIEGLFYRIE